MWKTAITTLDEGKIFVRGYELSELMEKCSFGDMVLLMATGKMPSLEQGRMVEALLVSCCDQGALPPTTNAARFIASCGVPLQAAVAAGILGFGDHHGGAIENCAKILQEAMANAARKPIDDIASEIIEKHAAKGERTPGFGHAYLEVDPRVRKLLEIAERNISPRIHIDLLLAIEKRLIREKGPHLAANINGAVAAAISDLGLDWKIGRGLFILSRSLGLIVHTLEEIETGKPYKKIAMEQIEYMGPEKRRVPDRD